MFRIKSTIVRGSGNRTYILYTLPTNYDEEGNNAFSSIENIVQANFVPRAIYNESSNKLTTDLTTAMTRDGVLSIFGNYQY